MYSAVVFPQAGSLSATRTLLQPTIPATVTGIYRRSLSWNPQSDNPADRTVYYADPSGVLTETQVIEALYTVAEYQEVVKGQINMAYASANSAPVSYTTKAGVVKSYQADDLSRKNMSDALLGFQSVGAVPPGFFWVASDNTQVPFTLADIQGLAAAAIAQGWTNFQKAQALKAQIRSATTIHEIQQIVW